MSPLIHDDYTVFASESNCLADAPDPYRSLMHYLHFLTVPLYTIAVYVLIFESPSSLREYRKYLLWHTLGNFLFEVYISIFMLPVVYLPAIVFRGAGILKHFKVSGLVQFYLLVGSCLFTGLSVMEMFKYRFNATIHEETFNKKLLQKIVVFFWIVCIFIPIFGGVTFHKCLPFQNVVKQKLWRNNPGISIEILCYNSVIAPPLLDPVFTPMLVLFIVTILTAIIIVPHTTFSILTKLKKLSKHLSKKTVEMQRMLLISLFMQAFIHGIMLGSPVFTFVYAIMFSLDNNELAYVLLLVISFHGSVSTFAMVFFTKPIRHGVMLLVRKAITLLIPSRVLITVSPPSAELTIEARNSVFVSKTSAF